MKQIVPELSRTAAQELVAEQRKEFRLIGSQRRLPGLILFEYDMTTGELRRADMTRQAELQMDGSVNVRSRVSSRELCLYVQALNANNAMRKVRQLLSRKTVREKLLKPKENGQK